MNIIITNIALVAYCKCGNNVAFTAIYGGVSIDEDFMTTIAGVHNRGGKVEIVNTDENPIVMGICSCVNDRKIPNVPKEERARFPVA